MLETRYFSELVAVDPVLPRSCQLSPNAEVSFIPMADVSESGDWHPRQTRRICEIGAGYTPFMEGDVLFAKITPCMENGKGTHACQLDGGVGFGSTEFFVLRSHPGVDARYIFHWSKSRTFRQCAQSFMIGSAGQQRVQSRFFGQFKVPSLPLEEQRQVSKILDGVDAALRRTEQIVEKLKLAKQGLLHDLLTRGIDDNGELRDPVRHPEQFKDSPLGRIPRSWEAHPLRSCLLGNPTNGLYKPASQIGRGTVIVGQTSFTDDRRVNWVAVRRAVVTDAEKISYGLRDGDILISRVFATVDGVGLPVQVTCMSEPAVFESNMMRLRAHPQHLSSRFLLDTLLSRNSRRFISSGVNLSNQASINQQMLNELPVMLPPLDEQSRMTSVIEEAETRLQQESSTGSKLRLLKQALMDDLLTGRVRVTPLLEKATSP